MHTIVLATQKGGSGKSTLAIGLALAAIQAGHHRPPDRDLTSKAPSPTGKAGGPMPTPLVEADLRAGDIEPALVDTGRQRRDAGDRRYRRRRQRRDHGRHPPCRSLPDPGPPERRRYRGDRVDARRSRLEHAVRLRAQPDPDPRPAHQQRRHHARRGSRARYPRCRRTPLHRDAQRSPGRARAGLAVSEYAPGSKSADEIRGLWHWIEAAA